MNSDNSGKNLPSVNMISEGTTLTGTLKTENDIRISGKLDGEARAEGKVIVSSSGSVSGNVEGADADIAGEVDGEIRITNKLVLRKSAVVDGDIYTKTILAEEGAKINGAINMSDNIKEEIANKRKSDSSTSQKTVAGKKKDEIKSQEE